MKDVDSETRLQLHNEYLNALTRLREDGYTDEEINFIHNKYFINKNNKLSEVKSCHYGDWKICDIIPDCDIENFVYDPDKKFKHLMSEELVPAADLVLDTKVTITTIPYEGDNTVAPIYSIAPSRKGANWFLLIECKSLDRVHYAYYKKIGNDEFLFFYKSAHNRDIYAEVFVYKKQKAD